MPIEQVMPALFQLGTATEALAALGADVALRQPDAEPSPEIASALQAVTAAAGVGDIGDLAPPQQAMVLGMVRMFLHQALDLLDHPDRGPGWTFTDPAILDGWGRGSAMLPPMIASAHPDLADVTTFLDVGTGVGLLALAATNVWPNATVVGIDPWAPSLERAKANVAHAALEDRVTLRSQALAEVDDVDAFDCVWIPTFFLTEAGLREGLPAVVKAARPGGWVVLGIDAPSPDPLAAATANLRYVRGGGVVLDADQAVVLLEDAGCVDAHAAALPGPAPIGLVLGQRP